MKRFIIILITMFAIKNTSAQIYEVGVFLGGSNFIGDVGATNYINPNQLAIGGIVKWNRSPRHSFRASLSFSNLKGVDSESSDNRRVARDYSFENSIVEFSAGMEFNFFDFDLHISGNKTTPYLFTGISVAHHDNFYWDGSGNIRSENTSSYAWGIPMVIGVKTTITNHIILAAEVGARYTFSDEIDGSVPDAPQLSQFSFGNTNSNDWYVFTGVTLTYTFGQRPCYCAF
jgi:hypothetical protein